MTKIKNNKGRNSLIVCIFGLIVTQTLISLNYIGGGFWHVVLAGFEAGTVGGIADWFAVKALFREIPIPFVRKHTNIIVKNRQKISGGIVDLVTNQWLSPEVIHQKIEKIPITGKLLTSFAKKEQIISFLKPILSQFIKNINDEKLEAFLLDVIEKQSKNIKLGTYLGKFLKDSVGTQSYQELWEVGLNSVIKGVNTSETKLMLKSALQKQANDYKTESSLKGFLVALGEGAKAIDYDSIVEKLLNAFNEIIESAKTNPDDVLRKNVDTRLLLFAQSLIDEDEKTARIIDDLQSKLLSDSNKKSIVKKIVSEVKSMLNNSSGIDNFLLAQVESFIKNLSENTELQQKIDVQIKSVIEKLVVDNHHEIGKMVAESLENLDDKTLVYQIEEKVGDDLQYIRLNGVIVGGFVGVVIACIRLLFGL